MLSNVTGERITPTVTSSCACSHEVSEVTRLSTVYITVCSSMDTPLSYVPRQPSILTTATNTESYSLHTGSSAISTVLYQHTSASLDTNIGSIQPKQTTHSPNQLHPTSVPPQGNTIWDPHETSVETSATQSMKRGETQVRSNHTCKAVEPMNQQKCQANSVKDCPQTQEAAQCTTMW